MVDFEFHLGAFESAASVRRIGVATPSFLNLALGRAAVSIECVTIIALLKVPDKSVSACSRAILNASCRIGVLW